MIVRQSYSNQHTHINDHTIYIASNRLGDAYVSIKCSEFQHCAQCTDIGQQWRLNTGDKNYRGVGGGGRGGRGSALFQGRRKERGGVGGGIGLGWWW